MIAIVVFALLVVMVWVDVSAWRVMSAANDSFSGRFLYVGLGLAGLAIGIWCGFYLEYQVSPTLRFFSFPIPVAVFHLEGGQWVDFVTPMPIVLALLDVAFVTVFFPFPLSLKAVLRRRRATRRSLQGLCVNCGYNLTGNVSGVCPECGEKASPRKPA